MDSKEELKVIAKKHSWVFEELALDEKYKEVNVILGASLKSHVSYILSRSNNRPEVAISILNGILTACGYEVSVSGNRIKDLIDLVRSAPWAVEEAVMVLKEREYGQLRDKGLKTLYQYLKQKFKSRRAIVETATCLILNQRRAVKSKSRTLGVY